jgi:hypothetical protein
MVAVASPSCRRGLERQSQLNVQLALTTQIRIQKAGLAHRAA